MGKLIEYKDLANKFDKAIPNARDIMESRTSDSGGGNMNNFIKRDEFENFKTHLDSKFDRLIDKVDENRRELKDDMKHQTTVTISVIGAITTVIGVIVPIILHFI
ncbi:hypothetical protein [Staphylococcus haemolyticus]|uniref:hypothetical protein n=1 Tax=Staphylococcus haemolyticus TaxID=1283 RepID=UPI002887471C|nr:hypothetical protein [Staphylococcus haemolyticus]MDT0722574.1 hypothetical protein [Staphylococcus haemolyticus]